MSNAPLIDNHGRLVNYLRLAVTDRCNLRCFYCMPAKGVRFLKNVELLSLAEQKRMLLIMKQLGVHKIRITGGEPFVYTHIEALFDFIASEIQPQTLHLTTNGVLTGKFLPKFKDWGLKSVNLSLDSTNTATFEQMSRRNDFASVWQTLMQLLDMGIALKLNAVITAGVNDAELIPLALLARDYPLDVRFIEEMPFNGVGAREQSLWWDYKRLKNTLNEALGELTPLPAEPNATAVRFAVEGFKGNIGIIAAFSRTFCGSCNRLRVTANGTLKTCLYDDGVLSVRDLLRQYSDDEIIAQKIRAAVSRRAKDGFEAEKNRLTNPKISESMTLIGG
ncbi:MAG: GTP 3',8-cyclase MoaA [Cytophagales bacterium]|nr:MAG: GTP 3',8-cyclase MoaA [Cytophagales bacterium]TAF62515.1 MAG: GTP 3',8-cyclase MoaA [Cytophagales bacterium]